MTASDGGASVACVGVVHVYRAFGTDTAALRGIDLTVPAGQHLALLGPSGSGKSTLLSLLAGIRQPSAGEIRIDDRDIARLPEAELRRYRARTVGTLLQGAANNLLSYASAHDNLRQTLQRQSRRHGAGDPAGELLDAVGLARPEQHIPIGRLSPSQQQAAAVAVAMSNRPRLLVADEPTSQLDPEARDRVLDAMLSLSVETGTTVVIVTHDGDVAERMQRILHLRDGRIGTEEHHQERLGVLGADRSVHLPEHFTPGWTTGTRVRFTGVTDDELRITRVSEP
jgi:putative ABC transport system ATP-binding protein